VQQKDAAEVDCGLGFAKKLLDIRHGRREMVKATLSFIPTLKYFSK
jgi:hypothetical protein